MLNNACKKLLLMITASAVIMTSFISQVGIPKAHASEEGLALTPPMGYSTWNAVRRNVSDALIRKTVDSMVSNGLVDLGYKYINIDDGWWDTEGAGGSSNGRDKDGNILYNKNKFPNGMKSLTDYVHSKGMKIGIYTDIGQTGCSYFGSYGYYQKDVDQFAEWGFDFIKLDACGGDAMGLDFKKQYAEFSQAIQNANPKRPMVLNICEWGKQQPWRWAPGIGQMWRVGFDIDNQGSFWNGVLYEIDRAAGHADIAGPGGWNDPDSLEVGVIADKPGQLSLNRDEAISNFSMWAILSAPLMLGLDVNTMDNPTTFSGQFADIVTNAEVIAVDQDAAGIQGTKVKESTPGLQVYAKPLISRTSGSRAVVLLNRTDAPTTMTVTSDQIGLLNQFSVRDLWQKNEMGMYTGSYSASVPAHGSVMLKISGTNDPSWTPPSPVVDPTQIPQTQMTASATSEELINESNGASNVLDGEQDTFWHTKWDKSNPLPQSITLNLGGTYDVNKIKVLPRQSGSNGMITAYNVYASTDGIQYTKVTSGTWAKDATEKTAEFPVTKASFIKLEATAGYNGWASAAEINVFRATVPATGVQLDKPQVLLKEGQTVELVATVLPENATNKNVTWASSDNTVAKVEVRDGKTVVTALKAGMADITVTTASGNFTAVSHITVQKGDSTQKAVTTLTAPGTVQTGGEFTVQLGLSSVTQSVYAQDIKMDYDSNVFEFVSARVVKDGVQLVETKNTLGKLRFIIASVGTAVTGDAGILELKFKAKTLPQLATGTIAVTDVTLGDALGAETKAQASTVNVSITTPPPGIPGDVNHDNKVSIGDLAIIAADYGKTTSSPDWEQVKQADVTGDGKIDIDDLALVARKIIE
ncbi:discoidin domain-containing protein [Paenibacillus aestuarii]|uniref:Alpha-galactosidase n=1 Tax=Paenibacillus aestuarii TaxID=516965 RepID=A0ABW0K162_9BACL|nr:discoidin domain-containing protein [Paenibacillus aestuarii]